MSTERKEENKAQTSTKAFSNSRLRRDFAQLRINSALGVDMSRREEAHQKRQETIAKRKEDGKRVVYYKLQVEFGTLSGSREYPEKW